MTDSANLTLQELTKIVTAEHREAKRLLDDLAALFVTLRRRHNIQPGDFLIIDQPLYDNLPFTPNWIKGTRMFPTEIADYILRRSISWQ
jgi:hypothetical protein